MKKYPVKANMFGSHSDFENITENPFHLKILLKKLGTKQEIPYAVNIGKLKNITTVHNFTPMNYWNLRVEKFKGKDFYHQAMREKRLPETILDQRLWSERFISSAINSISKEIATHNNFSAIFHIACPKSGGTLLSRIMDSLFAQKGWLSASPVPAFGERNMELDIRYILTALMLHPALKPVLLKQSHIDYSEYTQAQFENIIGLKKIFSVRNIYDQIYSEYKMLATSGEIRRNKDISQFSYADRLLLFPEYITSNVPESKYLDFIIKFRLPRICMMVARWLENLPISDRNVFIVDFDKFISDKNKLVGSLVNKIDLPFSVEQINRSICFADKLSEQGLTRKVNGKKGKGRDELPRTIKKEIKEYLDLYNLEDLSKKHGLSITSSN